MSPPRSRWRIVMRRRRIHWSPLEWHRVLLYRVTTIAAFALPRVPLVRSSALTVSSGVDLGRFSSMSGAQNTRDGVPHQCAASAAMIREEWFSPMKSESPSSGSLCWTHG